MDILDIFGPNLFIVQLLLSGAHRKNKIAEDVKLVAKLPSFVIYPPMPPSFLQNELVRFPEFCLFFFLLLDTNNRRYCYKMVQFNTGAI